jgi:hypothetical protein
MVLFAAVYRFLSTASAGQELDHDRYGLVPANLTVLF